MSEETERGSRKARDAGGLPNLSAAPEAADPSALAAIADSLAPEASPWATEVEPDDSAPAAEAAPVDGGIDGSIDVVTATRIQGWARPSAYPNVKLELTLLVGATAVKTRVANELRRDLVDQGDGRCGFTFDLSDNPLGVGVHSLAIVSAASGAHVPGSPFQVEIFASETAEPVEASAASAAPAAGAIRGYLDDISDISVSGWVMDPAEPSRRCTVRLVEGEKTLARSRADTFRPDLREAGIGDGHCAFSMPMPRALIDGREHLLQVVEDKTGVSIHGEPIRWRSSMGVVAPEPPAPKAPGAASPEVAAPRTRSTLPATAPVRASRADAADRLTLIIDLSDLVYYIGHHDNLTGIQRVQSSIVLAIANSEGAENVSIVFVSFYNAIRKWVVIPNTFMITLLSDLFYPKALRRQTFNAQDARNGLLPGSVELDASGAIDPKSPSVLCLLGAAWVQRDYFRNVLALKRRYGTKFAMLVHDLIPIYARETCDQGTAQVFESFFLRAMRHVDQYLCVSENTAKDLRNYLTGHRARIPQITVTRLGGSFSEFLSDTGAEAPDENEIIPERFVLFVSTIEGRKNHKFMFDVWRAMVERGEDPPTLLCVGRIGWKAESFISDLVESRYLDGRVVIMEDVSDAKLQSLYQNCLFTVFPSVYEGWGLPVGEALAYGKICVCSDRASIPEVAGEFGVYVDIDDLPKAVEIVGNLARNEPLRAQIEQKIRAHYKPTSWDRVARTVLEASREASQIKWAEPYPYAQAPYSAEIGFSWLTRNFDGVFGADLLARTLNARMAHILNEPLSEQNLLLGEDARTTGSWSEPEAWGCWLCEGPGEIVVALPANESRFYYVFVRIRAVGMGAQSRVRLRANGAPVWDNAIGENSRNIVLRIAKPASGPASGWRLQLQAAMDVSDDLRQRIAAVDGRIPLIGFERLAVIPENDLQARLDVMTRMLLEKS